MSVTDARLSFERHATSKIRSAEDLFQLHTKGFRGEALASIAAIAHVEMNTCQEEDEVGTLLRVEGGKVTNEEVVVTPKGTSIAVKNLFFNIPARRNFLKSDTVELRHILDEFHRVVLAHPSIHFMMYNNGNEIFNLPAGNYRQRIVHVMGGKTNEKLVPVEETTEVLKITGFVIKPEYAKKSKSEQFFFVNNRFIKSGYLHHAVMASYEGILKDQMQPGYFLYLDVNPASIDINIHPTKTEIKFDDEHTLYALLKSAVKHSLGQFNVAPILDFDRDPSLDTPYTMQGQRASYPTIEVDANFNPFEDEPKVSSGSKGSSNYMKNHLKSPSWESLYTDVDTSDFSSQQSFSSLEMEPEEVIGSLFESSDESVQQNTQSYQLNKKYIVTHIKSGMVIIDQQRAHQRVLYEHYLQLITGGHAASQQLLFPLDIAYTVNERAILEVLQERLVASGFILEFMDEVLRITGVPLEVTEREVYMIIQQLISDFENDLPESGYSQTDMLVKSMAKSLAIKTGQQLTNDEQEGLVHKLFACEEPTMSPFQKTTFIQLTIADIDKKFN